MYLPFELIRFNAETLDNNLALIVMTNKWLCIESASVASSVAISVRSSSDKQERRETGLIAGM